MWHDVCRGDGVKSLWEAVSRGLPLILISRLQELVKSRLVKTLQAEAVDSGAVKCARSLRLRETSHVTV